MPVKLIVRKKKHSQFTEFREIKKSSCAKFWEILFFIDWRNWNFDFCGFESAITFFISRDVSDSDWFQWFVLAHCANAPYFASAEFSDWNLSATIRSRYIYKSHRRRSGSAQNRRLVEYFDPYTALAHHRRLEVTYIMALLESGRGGETSKY